MFERIETEEYIYEGVVEHSKKKTRADANRDYLSRKMRGESDLSAIYSKTSESDGKQIKRYVNHPKDR